MEKHQNPIYALNVLLRWTCCILLFWMGLQYLITASTLCFWLGALFLLPKKGRASLLWTLLADLLWLPSFAQAHFSQHTKGNPNCCRRASPLRDR